MTDGEIVNALGEDGIARLVAAFYRRVATDDLVGAMYPLDDLPAAEERLRDFLIQRFGGPDRYSQQRGHPRLRMRHAPFPIDAAAADRWLTMMEAAMEETQVPPDVAELLRSYFRQTATHMINRSA
jgi:hemoglobin